MDIRPIGPEEAETVARYANAAIAAALRRDPELPQPPGDPVLLLWVIRELALHVTLRYEEIGALSGVDVAQARAHGLRQVEGRNTDLDLLAMTGQMPPPPPPVPSGRDVLPVPPPADSDQAEADAWRLVLSGLRNEPAILSGTPEPAFQRLAGVAGAAVTLAGQLLVGHGIREGLSQDEAEAAAVRYAEDASPFTRSSSRCCSRGLSGHAAPPGRSR